MYMIQNNLSIPIQYATLFGPSKSSKFIGIKFMIGIFIVEFEIITIGGDMQYAFDSELTCLS